MLSKGSRILPWIIKTYPFQFLIFLAFIIISGVAFRIASFHYEDAVDTAIHRNKSIASSSARIILESLEKAVVNIRSYGNGPLIIKSARNKDSKEIIRHLASMKKDNPEIDMVLSRTGTGRSGRISLSLRKPMVRVSLNLIGISVQTRNGNPMSPMYMQELNERVSRPSWFVPPFRI